MTPVPHPASPPTAITLSRRERQIMDVIYRLGRASAAEVHERLPEAPCAAAVRTMLRILERKGHLRHAKEGPRHVYMATTPRSVARRSALRHLLGTFFNGSRSAAVAALLDASERPLDRKERQELEAVLRRLRDEGR